MRVVIQRVAEAHVKVDGKIVGSIGKGLLVLVGIEDADSKDDVEWISGQHREQGEARRLKLIHVERRQS